ncbi:19368_t:CDS:1, partial [Dentiscutata erythropus]
ELESVTMLSTDVIEKIEEVESELMYILFQLVKFKIFWDYRNVRLENLIQRVSTESSDVLLHIVKTISE